MKITSILFAVIFLLTNCKTVLSPIKIKELSVQFLGESDKAPPIVVCGSQKPSSFRDDARFHEVESKFFEQVQSKCMTLSYPRSETSSSVLKIIIRQNSKSEVLYLSDEDEISKLLSCFIELADNFNYSLLDLDLHRILNASVGLAHLKDN